MVLIICSFDTITVETSHYRERIFLTMAVNLVLNVQLSFTIIRCRRPNG